MNTWKPISESELKLLIQEASNRMPPDLLARFDSLKTPIRQIDYKPQSNKVQKFFVIAHYGSKVLFYDDVEEEFGTAAFEGNEIARGSLFGELEWALTDLLKSEKKP